MNATRAPPPRRFSAQIVPPCACTSPCAIARPEPGAAARARARVVGAPEALEHPLRAARREPVAVVLDGYEHSVPVLLDHDRDLAVGPRVAERVREQVHEHALHLVGRHGDDWVGGHPRPQPHAARRRVGLERVHAGRHEVGERSLLQLERERAGVDPREHEQVLDEPGEDLRLRPDRGEVLLRPREPVLERLDHRAQRGERRAQVVAGPHHELAARVEQLLQVRGHLVERRTELLQLARPGGGSARAQVAAGEPLRRRTQSVERLQDPLAQEECRGQRAEGRRGDDEPERLLVAGHVEHHEPGQDHRGERQADCRDRQHRELRPDAHSRSRRRQSRRLRSLLSSVEPTLMRVAGSRRPRPSRAAAGRTGRPRASPAADGRGR